ncbi:unnamed protein product [Schistosoma curassoni]|uniref:Uncharacterized protein n=1 Tax=Schistosoma curassoni TaxID=6186 RepID=A0A183K2D4_9TREM|nr:unnamed protein product [Schistosoma curassoni]
MLMLILIIELGTYYFEYQRSIQYDLDSVKQLTCSACIKLSTYEFKVFESCSMWLNDNLMVNLLLRCPDKSNRKLQMRQSTNNIPKDKLNLKYSQNSFIKNQSSLMGNSSIVENNYIKLNKYSKRSTKIFNKRSSSSTSLKSLISHSPLIDRKKHPSQFTLLVEEFAWANGNPSFPVNRPVYFLGKYIHFQPH